MATPMQFWGVQVTGGKPHKVELEEGHGVHLSQATLGDLKKDNSDPVTIYVEVGEEKKKFVLGLLSQNTPQLSFDLVFEQNFQISHNWKNGSVHLLGYQILLDEPAPDFDADSSDEEEEVPVDAKPAAPALPNVKETKANNAKPEEDDEDTDDEEDDSDDEMAASDDSDEDDEDDSEDEEPPKVEQVKQGKKRPSADSKTPDSKKVKLVTPQKTEGKKGVHPATPHPSKKEGKTPGGGKATLKPGQVSCDPCKKTFGSAVALESHNKAKHKAAK